MLSNVEKIYGLSLLWKEVEYNFANFDLVPNLNWDEVYKRFIEEVVNTKTNLEYYRVLQKFIALLKDGHSYIVMPKEYSDNVYYPKIRVKALDKKIIVTKVDDEKLIGQLEVGSEIVEFNDMTIDAYLEDKVIPYINSSTEYYLWAKIGIYLLMSYENEDIKIKAKSSKGILQEFVIDRYNLGENGMFKLLDILEPGVEFKWVNKDTAYISTKHFGTIEVYKQFLEYVPEIKKAKGIIIDVRNNTGGSSMVANNIIKLFTNKTLIDSKARTPKHIASFKARKKPYDNFHIEEPCEIECEGGESIEIPMAVLIGNATFSAAEDFLVTLDSINRATYIGQRSGGSTGQPLTLKLPGGGFGAICSKKDSYPDGREFVGCGVEPHIYVEPTLDDILEITDNTLDKAVKFINEQIKE